VGLHDKLAANLVIVVNHQVINPMLDENFAGRQSGRACPDDSHTGAVHLDPAFFIHRLRFRAMVFRNFADLPDPVNGGNTDPFYFPVNQHFTGSALAYAALQTPVSAFQTVAMDRITGLVQGCCNGQTFLACNLLAFKYKRMTFAGFNLKYRMLVNFQHFI
jgi:hypothetical protein